MRQMLKLIEASVLLATLCWGASAHAEFKKATKYNSPAACPSGSFWDPRNGGECWSCGSRSRSAWPVNGDKACFTPAKEDLSKATRGKDLGCDSGAIDIGKNVCWSCSDDYERSVFAVDSNKACHLPASEKLTSAKHLRDNTEVGQGCPKGWFWDAKQNSKHGLPRSAMGACWDCPSGYSRTGHAVDGKKACSKAISEDYESADLHGAPKNACKSSEFRHGLTNQCWSCPDGYNRTANAIDGNAACSKAIPETFAKAEYKAKFQVLNACGDGRFYDLATKSCWSCPAGYVRSVAAVTSDKACTNQPLEVLTADVPGMCNATIAALNGGNDALITFQDMIKPVVDPVRSKIDQGFKEVTDKVKAPAELDKLLKQVTDRVGDPIKVAIDTAIGFERNLSNLKQVLLNADAMCSGDLAKLDRALNRAGFGKEWKEKGAFLAVAGNFLYVDPDTHLGTIQGLFAVTDFNGEGGIYLSVGPAGSTAIGPQGSVGAMYFPKITLDEFGPSWVTNLSLGAGDKPKKIIMAVGGKIFPTSLDFTFDPTFKASPGIGVSKGWGGEGLKLVDVTPSATYSFPLFKWTGKGVSSPVLKQ